jgi:hypothetical protein
MTPAIIAHHEAGHTVMAAILGLRFDTVSIEPDGPTLGKVLVYPPQDFADDSKDEEQIGNMLLMVLAGPVAAQRFSNICRLDQIGNDLVCLLEGHNSDYARALKLSAMLHGIPLGLEAGHVGHSDTDTMFEQLEYSEEQVYSVFNADDGAGWKAVEALAAALLERKTLDHESTLAIIGPILFPDVAGKAA